MILKDHRLRDLFSWTLTNLDILCDHGSVQMWNLVNTHIKPRLSPAQAPRQYTIVTMRNSFLYHPYYCEENVWQLAKELDENGGNEGEIWFIINKNQTIATAQQRAAYEDSFVIWDYHVVYYSPDGGVFDLDTRCSFPCSVERYLKASFLSISSLVSPEYYPYFRVIPAKEYLSLFSSNREHMLGDDGDYLQPPPKWSVIGKGSNLASFMDFNNQSIGEILSLDALISRSL